MSGFEREQRVFSFQDGHKRYRWLVASPAQRIVAAVLDGLLTAAAAAPAAWLHHRYWGDWVWPTGAELQHSWPLAAAWAGGLVYGLVQVWLLGRCGQTVGKWLAGVRIVRADGKAAGIFHAWMMRSLVFALLCLIAIGALLRLLGLDDNFAWYELFWLPYVICFGMLFNLHDDCRTLQDKLAGTAVVQAKMHRAD